MVVIAWTPAAQGNTARGVPILGRVLFTALGAFYLLSAWSIHRTRPPKGLQRYQDDFQGADFGVGEYKFPEAPQFASQRQAAEWLIGQVQLVARSVHAEFKPTIVSDKEIMLDLRDYWMTMAEMNQIIGLGAKHGFKIVIRGKGKNPFIPPECYEQGS